MVTSTLTFAPVPEDDGATLKCQGDNPSLPGTGLEDSFLLNIVCKLLAIIFKNLVTIFDKSLFEIIK